MAGIFALPEGRAAVQVFHLLAERYLDPAFAPEAAEPSCGVPAATIRRIAAELAHVAFEPAVTLDIPWTDTAGRHHPTTSGRPVAIHAMRGIAAHANGFQTTRALHLLQMLLGTIDCPGGFRFKPPFPKPIPPGPKPAGRVCTPGHPLGGPPLCLPTGPEDLLLHPDGTPARLDRAFSWEAPLAAHGMMQSVIANAAAGDPYPIDTLFLFMANMAWNSAMNTAGTMDMPTARDPATGEYRIPHIIYADAFASEMVAYADLVLPDRRCHPAASRSAHPFAGRQRSNRRSSRVAAWLMRNPTRPSSSMPSSTRSIWKRSRPAMMRPPMPGPSERKYSAPTLATQA